MYSNRKIGSFYGIFRRLDPVWWAISATESNFPMFIMGCCWQVVCGVPSQVFTVFRLLTDFVCLYTYEFWLSLCKIVRSSVILLLPLWNCGWCAFQSHILLSLGPPLALNHRLLPTHPLGVLIDLRHLRLKALVGLLIQENVHLERIASFLTSVQSVMETIPS